MAVNIFDYSLQGAYFVLLVVFLPITIASAGFRVMATQRAGRKNGVDDWAAYIAFLFYLYHTIASLYVVVKYNGRSFREIAITAPEEYAVFRKLAFSLLFTYPLEMFFAKGSILALYYRVFSVNRRYKWWIIGLAVVHLLWVIEVIAVRSKTCTPIRKFWYPLSEGTCLKQETIATIGETINSAVDFAMVALACVMLRSLKMPASVKRKLYVLFGLGSIVGIVGIVKVALQYDQDGVYVYMMLGTIATVQLSLAIICCCAPVYSPILPQEGLWSRVISVITSRGRSRSGGSTPRRVQTQSSAEDAREWINLEENPAVYKGTDGQQQNEIRVEEGWSQGPDGSNGNLSNGIRVKKTVDVS